MISGLHQGAAELNRLRQENTQLRGAPKPAETQKLAKPLEEQILEDPRSVITSVLTESLGEDLNEMRAALGESLIDSFRLKDPDFADYEDEVRGAIRASGAKKVTRDLIQGAYLMAAGKRALSGKGDSGKKLAGSGATGSRKPSGEEDPPKKKGLTDMEKEFAKGMHLTEEKYAKAKENRAAGVFAVKVPDGKPKGGNDGGK